MSDKETSSSNPNYPWDMILLCGSNRGSVASSGGKSVGLRHLRSVDSVSLGDKTHRTHSGPHVFRHETCAELDDPCLSESWI